MKKIVLASASLRRRDLLERLGLQFEVDSAAPEEVIDPSLPPRELVKRLSLQKAEAVARKHPHCIIIAADTVGFLDGTVLGKPGDESGAKRMLRFLSGKPHLVITGFTIIDTETGRALTRSVETKVYIKLLTNGEIDAYVRTGEPLDKAGAYAIQGLGAIIVERIEGDYYNVVGLPLNALADSLKEFGIDVWKERVSPD